MCRLFSLTYYSRNRLIILELTNRISLDEVQTCDRICNVLNQPSTFFRCSNVLHYSSFFHFIYMVADSTDLL